MAKGLILHAVVLSLVGEILRVAGLQHNGDVALAHAATDHVGTAIAVVLGAQDLHVGDNGASAILRIGELQAHVLRAGVLEGVGSLGHQLVA